MKILITGNTKLRRFIRHNNNKKHLITHLTLHSCTKLTVLSLTYIIANLHALTRLEITNCENLTELPDSIRTLRALTDLELNYCKKLKYVPASIGTLQALTYFSLNSCNYVTQLPDSIGALQALKYLSIYDFENLTDYILPNSICFCKNLEEITVSNINTLPPSMILLKKINDIHVVDYGCSIRHNINEMRTLWYRMLLNMCVM